MRKFDLRMNVVALLTLFMLVGNGMTAWAEGYPSLSELVGRYRLTGECMVEGEGVFPSTTDYDIVILPGEDEGTVQLNGWFGFGGGFSGTYDESTGVLSCSFPAAYLCANMDLFYTAGVMATIDAGSNGMINLKFAMSTTSDGIVLSTDSSLVAQAFSMSDMMSSEAAAGYLQGFTLTKQSVNVPQSELPGTYQFKGRSGLISNMVDGAGDEFTMTVSSSGDNKLKISGLFGIPECMVEATYYADGGIVVFPHDVRFTEKLFMGNDMENGIMAYEAAPYFFVNGTEWTSPSSFILNGGMEMDMDYEMEMPQVCSFIGGTAVKTGTDAIQTVGIASKAQITVANKVITVASPSVETVKVYDVQGLVVASAIGTKVTINSLPAGMYIVKVGKEACKIAL